MPYKIVSKVECRLTPEEWELYCSNPGVQQVAYILNNSVEHFCNNGYQKDQGCISLNRIFKEFTSYGAVDAEPMDSLDKILTDVFPG